MLADPGLGVAELVELDDLVEILLEGLRQIGTGGVQRHGEQTNVHLCGSPRNVAETRSA